MNTRHLAGHGLTATTRSRRRLKRALRRYALAYATPRRPDHALRVAATLELARAYGAAYVAATTAILSYGRPKTDPLAEVRVSHLFNDDTVIFVSLDDFAAVHLLATGRRRSMTFGERALARLDRDWQREMISLTHN